MVESLVVKQGESFYIEWNKDFPLENSMQSLLIYTNVLYFQIIRKKTFFYLPVHYSIFADLVLLYRERLFFSRRRTRDFLTFFFCILTFWVMWVTLVSRVSHIVCIFLSRQANQKCVANRQCENCIDERNRSIILTIFQVIWILKKNIDVKWIK